MDRRWFVIATGAVALVYYGSQRASTDNNANATPSTSPAEAQQQAARRNPEKFLEITKFSWSKEGFGAFMHASFTIKNSSALDIKDVSIRCTHHAPSGTVIDSNERTIYEIVKANSTRSFREFNMGFIHSQAKSGGCAVVNASLL